MLVFSQKDADAAWLANISPQVIPTGFNSIDIALSGGLPVSQIVTLLGYSGIGKSEFARQIRNRVGQSNPVIHVDVELGLERIYQRDLSQKALVSASHVRKRLFTKEELDKVTAARKALAENKWIKTICPSTNVDLKTLGTVLEECIDSYDTDKPVLIILDSLQRLSHAVQNSNRRLQIEGFMLWAERFAHSHNACLLVISEMRRTSEGIIPSPDEALTAGAESRAIEFTSDVLMSLVPQGKLTSMKAGDAEEHSERICHVLIAKNRLGTDGYCFGDFVFIRPCWQLEWREGDKDKKKISDVPEDVWKKALLTVFPNTPYKVDELRKTWNTSGQRTKQIISSLINAGKFTEIDTNIYIFKKDVDIKKDSGIIEE